MASHTHISLIAFIITFTPFVSLPWTDQNYILCFLRRTSNRYVTDNRFRLKQAVNENFQAYPWQNRIRTPCLHVHLIFRTITFPGSVYLKKTSDHIAVAYTVHDRSTFSMTSLTWQAYKVDVMVQNNMQSLRRQVHNISNFSPIEWNRLKCIY